MNILREVQVGFHLIPTSSVTIEVSHCQTTADCLFAGHSGEDMAYDAVKWKMTNFCQLQLAAKSQSNPNAGCSDALRLPSDLQGATVLKVDA